MLKEIGKRARMDIENLLGSKVFLELWVKVQKDWRIKPVCYGSLVTERMNTNDLGGKVLYGFNRRLSL